MKIKEDPQLTRIQDKNNLRAGKTCLFFFPADISPSSCVCLRTGQWECEKEKVLRIDQENGWNPNCHMYSSSVEKEAEDTKQV